MPELRQSPPDTSQGLAWVSTVKREEVGEPANTPSHLGLQRAQDQDGYAHTRLRMGGVGRASSGFQAANKDPFWVGELKFLKGQLPPAQALACRPPPGPVSGPAHLPFYPDTMWTPENHSALPANPDTQHPFSIHPSHYIHACFPTTSMGLGQRPHPLPCLNPPLARLALSASWPLQGVLYSLEQPPAPAQPIREKYHLPLAPPGEDCGSHGDGVGGNRP